ncbi:ARM repeat-containing protein [Stereum hirsutum FP-91666 SS1]|uniref:ARM repeat-containing protein n=1 Tax=Stereum hirsutum (strain FP-91666) TaxID=721885 RepID=UPI000440BF37|nr:ARM repeat-containing protein [Stereum hirsutum FP-91666 SS1]EIM89256.1 ARM repeat-containing protein [Stereum hirsutum FP-91666 SS1]
MPARVLPARTTSVLDNLSTAIPKIFDQVQNSTSNHQKNHIALYKLQTQAAAHTEDIPGRGNKLIGERAFENVIIDMINRILVVKKAGNLDPATRCLKFIGSYIRFIHDKSAEEKKAQRGDQDEDSDDDEEEEHVVVRFTNRILQYLLKGFLAKDKVVRHRAVSFVAEMISHLGTMDDEMYVTLRSSLMERASDKEHIVRMQAVSALSKLCGGEDPDELADGEPTILSELEDIMVHDPSADVRRICLANLAQQLAAFPLSLKVILTRIRDTEWRVRKEVYVSLLKSIHLGEKGDAVGPTHPRVLSIDQRESIVRIGLHEREREVKTAAEKLILAWLTAVSVGEKKDVMEDLFAFLKLFDLTESKTAEEALTSVFKTKPEIVNEIQTDDMFWADLSPEKVFLVRVLVDHAVEQKSLERLETILPVVTALAFRIQTVYNDLIEQAEADEQDRLLRGEDAPEDEERADALLDKEFVVEELLRIAVKVDYGDEIGRRKMFTLVRDMISQEALPERLLTRCLDVLRVLVRSEKELIRIVVEVVHELRDTDEELPKEETNDDDLSTVGGTARPRSTSTQPAAPKAVEDMTPEERARQDAVDIRCLDLCIGMLERCNSKFDENVILQGLMAELVIPSAQKKDFTMREKALTCLGLTSLISRDLAFGSFHLFMKQIPTSPEELKVRIIQVIIDVFMVHEVDFLANEKTDDVINYLREIMENDESDRVQAVLAMGFAKLMLSRMVTEDKVLASLVAVYVSPYTADNQELRQCLSYFFPVFCWSSPVNQRQMQKVFPAVFERLCKESNELEEDQEMVTPAQIAGMFVDWTDPRKVSELVPGSMSDPEIHFDMAHDIMTMLAGKALNKSDKKVLCQHLSKLHIPDVIDDDKVRKLKLLMHTLESRRPLSDTPSKKAVEKFDASISKKFSEQLRDFSEEEYRKLESLKETFEVLDLIRPVEEDSDYEEEGEKEKTKVAKKRLGKKRRSGSITTDTSAGEEAEEDQPRKKNGKGKAKRRRVSGEDEVEDDDSVPGSRQSSVTPSAPTRTMPKRAATKKVSMAPVVLEDEEDDEEDEDEEDEESTPVPPSRRSRAAASKPMPKPKASSSSRRKQPTRDEEDDDEEDSEGPSASVDGDQDSVAGPEIDEEEDDDEVADLLEGDDSE